MPRTRQQLEQMERENLAAIKLRFRRSKISGDAPGLARTQYQRDRDRVIHSAPSAGWNTKPQVFLNSTGDTCAPG